MWIPRFGNLGLSFGGLQARAISKIKSIYLNMIVDIDGYLGRIQFKRSIRPFILFNKFDDLNRSTGSKTSLELK